MLCSSLLDMHLQARNNNLPNFTIELLDGKPSLGQRKRLLQTTGLRPALIDSHNRCHSSPLFPLSEIIVMRMTAAMHVSFLFMKFGGLRTHPRITCNDFEA